MSVIITENDTIAAISTGMTPAGISIIRISGPKASDVCDRVFRVKKNAALSPFCYANVESHTVHYGYVVDAEEKILDEVMLLVLKAPRTFTKEDTVEIDCHGGIVGTRRILRRIFEAGARPAEPGEFTKRAFLNGRIDLSQAEAVIDVINSKNELALNNSVKQLKGNVQKEVVSIREQILREVARIEAALDDPEHMSLDGYSEELLAATEEHLKEVRKLAQTADRGRLLSEGIRTVICGKPNAGKSSLMNALLRFDRAIVTDVAGTTRDTLTEEVNLDGITLQLVDTAGIRETSDVVERIGVDRAKKELSGADLILFVMDGSGALTEEDKEIAESIVEVLETAASEQRKKVLVLRNKCDLPTAVSNGAMEAFVKEQFGEYAPAILTMSAKESEGIEELEETIKGMFFAGNLKNDDEIIITAERHRSLLCQAADSLARVIETIELGMPEDCYTIDLMAAYVSLGQILGEELDEDLVDMIFKEFCMGK